MYGVQWAHWKLQKIVFLENLINFWLFSAKPINLFYAKISIGFAEKSQK